MKFQQYYSSSTSNLYMVTSRTGKRLMIECGINFKKIQKALDFNFDGISACLLSHEHLDHSRAVTDIIKAGIDVYSSGYTFKALGMNPVTPAHRLHPIGSYKVQEIDGFKFMAFETEHNAADPYGYVVYCDNEYLLFATDTAFIRPSYDLPFDIIAIEASYDHEILKKRMELGLVNEQLAKKLLGRHQEISTAVRYLDEFCNMSSCRQIHLIHMSFGNQNTHNTKKLFADKFLTEVVTR